VKSWQVDYTMFKRGTGVQHAGHTFIEASDLTSLYRKFRDYTKSPLWSGFVGWKLTGVKEAIPVFKRNAAVIIPGSKPLCIDLYCGLGGWSDGFLAEGYQCVGYDITRHDYGSGAYPGCLVIQDVRRLRGSEFQEAAVIVASPPCQEYSYRHMPWKRARSLPAPSNELFDACFRIQREAIESSGRYIPLIVENVVGAQKWVGRAKWHYGSYYLWGDVPALMPFSCRSMKSNGNTHARLDGPGRPRFIREDVGLIQKGQYRAWFNDFKRSDGYENLSGRLSYTASGSPRRKAASAEIAKIPLALARWIAHCYKPTECPAHPSTLRQDAQLPSG
jgi:hypothetical protein